MKKLIAIMLALTMLATLAACGNSNAAGKTETKWLIESETYVYEDDSWGTVKTTFSYDKKGNLLKSTQESDGQSVDAVYSYDRKGFCTGIEMKQDGSSMRYDITNDDKGNRIKTELYNGNILMQTIQCTYDEKGNVLTQETINTNYSMMGTYTYDDNGNVLSVTNTANGTILSKITIEYDSEGRQTRSVATDAKGNVTSIIEATFDGNVETQIAKDASGNIIDTTVKTRDEHGNVVKIEVSGGSSDYVYTATFISIEVPSK